jgi:hypothetical protein
VKVSITSINNYNGARKAFPVYKFKNLFNLALDALVVPEDYRRGDLVEHYN